jgi:FtsH-binding integral membrane protein
MIDGHTRKDAIMTDDRDIRRTRTASWQAEEATVDAGLRAFMRRVYTYMASSLALTGLVAYEAAASGFYESIVGTLLFWLILLAPLGFVLVLSFGIDRMSVGTAQLLFWIYAAVMGLSLAGIFLVFTGASVPPTPAAHPPH